MEENKEQYKKIFTTLVTEGSFAISKIEQGNNISREQIGKIIKKLVIQKILKQNVKKGAGVQYKLAKTTEGIIFLLQNTQQLTIDKIAQAWNVSVSSAKKYIKQFVDQGMVEKIGKPPKKINYILTLEDSLLNYPSEHKEIINKYYSYLTPEGRFLKGIKGFEYQMSKQFSKQDIKSMAKKYVEIRREYYGEALEKNKIDVTNILQYVFNDEAYLKKLFYSDFDKLPVFNESKLMQLIKIAKSGQKNTELMVEIANSLNNSIQKIIEEYNIDAVGFIPPTMMRKTQLMTFFKKRLNINLPQIKLEKVKNLLPVQQITLKSIQDRIKNAKESIQIKSLEKYKNILLIDDVVGSGATLNETAKKLINQEIATKVYAVTVIGPINPGKFEIIPKNIF